MHCVKHALKSQGVSFSKSLETRFYCLIDNSQCKIFSICCLMKPNRPRVLASTRHSITVTWGAADSPSPHASMTSLLQKSPRQSRTSLTSEDRKVSKTSLGSTEMLSSARNRAKASLGSSYEEASSSDGTDGNLPVFVIGKECYTLQIKDRLIGWCNVYSGYKTYAEVGPLPPGDCYQFRLKVTSEDTGESEWSEILTATTKDDIIAVSNLHRAIESGHLLNVRKVLNQRPLALEIPNKSGQTPLGIATVKNDINLVNVLLAYGADVDSIEVGSWRTPLMTASYKGHSELVEILREKGSSWEIKDRSGLTALHYAVDNSHLEVVQKAIEEGADIKAKDKFGWSPMMRGVILRASTDVLQYLLDKGSDANESDSRNQTLLMQAVLSDRPEVVQLLLKKGADIEAKNIYGHTAYDMAKSSSNKEMQKILHLLGKEPETESLTTPKRKVTWFKASVPGLLLPLS